MYTIVYNKLVASEDFRGVSLGDKRMIWKAIDKKLKTYPEIFGKPLHGNLKGLYRLRVSHYRVVYSIKKQEIIVYIIKIGLRKDLLVYIEAAKRLKLLK